MRNAIKIAVIDDHHLFRSGLINLIKNIRKDFNDFLEAENAEDFIEKIKKISLPNLIFLDVNMPGIGGVALSKWLQKNHPDIPVVVLSMIDDESTIISMLRNGVKGYLSKNIDPVELECAINSVLEKGYYYTEQITGKLLFQLSHENKTPVFNSKELHFLQLSCSELTYKEIADIMCLSFKTIDGYRKNVFDKMNVKSRVGMVLYAIKFGIIKEQTMASS